MLNLEASVAILNTIERETSEAVSENRLDIIAVSGCSKCKSILRSIEILRRADGNALQLVTCSDCNHEWKELWIH